MTIAFETSDPGNVHRFLATCCGDVRMTMDRPGRVRVVGQGLGPIRLHRVTVHMRCEVDGAAPGCFAFARVAGGEAGCASEPVVTPGGVFVAAQPGRPFRVVLHHADLELALVDPGLLAEVAGGWPVPPLFTGFRPVSPAAAGWWNATYDYVHAAVAGGSVPAAEPLIAGGLARLLAAAALAAFPHTGPAVGEDTRGLPVMLRSAIAFIDANSQRDIAVADIAAAAHVSVRALQLAFRRHLGTTPVAELRRVRLEQAHRDLRDTDPAAASVGEIAARWGFGSQGRFAAAYRAAYGCAPSRTLREG